MEVAIEQIWTNQKIPETLPGAAIHVLSEVVLA